MLCVDDDAIQFVKQGKQQSQSQCKVKEANNGPVEPSSNNDVVYIVDLWYGTGYQTFGTEGRRVPYVWTLGKVPAKLFAVVG